MFGWTVLSVSHSTGLSPIVCMIRSTRSRSPAWLPASTLAASLVPMAATQQPSKPWAMSDEADSTAFGCPWNPSTDERAPAMSVRTSVAPTRRYCASTRSSGSGR